MKKKIAAVTFTVALGLSGQGAKDCAYEKAYGDGAFRVNSATCQQCKDGSWFDKAEDACTSDPVATSDRPIRQEYDCEYNQQLYSNGAYHLNNGNCQRCGNGQFLDAPASACSAR
jgi:ribosomal protein S27AE